VSTGNTVTLVSAADLAYLYEVPPITVQHWRRRQPAATAPGAPERTRHNAAGPHVYDPEAAAGSILGPRYAHISGRDLFDLDVALERIRARTRLGDPDAYDKPGAVRNHDRVKREPSPERLDEVRKRATMPADAVPAGYAEVGELLGLDQRHVKVLDDRGHLPPPIALVGPPGSRQIKVFAASQFARDARYSEQRAQQLAARHRDGP
jgi:hypothetical protein